MIRTPSIIVYAQSRPWCAAIKRQFTHHHLSWVLGTDGLAAEVLLGKSNVAIVEIPSRNPERTCLELAHLANNPFQLALFAVGDDEIPNLAPLLQSTGFAAWYGSLLQIPELARAVAQHQLKNEPPLQPFEQTVWDGLPWPTRH